MSPRVLVRRLQRAVRLDPRLGLVPKTALAVVLAWLVIQPLGGFADEYPYYAPLGAVVSTSVTVASSLRVAGQIALSLVLGAALALAALAAPLPEVVALAFVVAAGTWLSGWRRVAATSTWVPISALFILIVGRNNPEHYVTAYLGLTVLGALVGVGVNLAFPSLPLVSARAVQDSLRQTLADQLDDLATGLTEEPPPTGEQWRARLHEIVPRSREMSQGVGQAVDAQRVNWRAKYWRDTAARQYQQARALEQLAFCVDEITDIVIDGEHAERDDVALGPALRPTAAEALRAAAEMLRSVDRDGLADPEARRRAHSSVEQLATLVRRQRAETDEEFFMAGSLVTAVRRALDALSPMADPVRS